MGSPIKFKPKLRLGEMFGKGLGSVFDYLSPSMQLSALKIMKKMHPVFADRFIYELGRKFTFKKNLPPSLQEIGYGKKDKKARELRSWVYDNINYDTGDSARVHFGWPKLLQYTLRKGERERPSNFLRFNEDYLKHMETEDYKYDMALQDQISKEELKEEEILADILEFKKPEKYRGGLISLIS